MPHPTFLSNLKRFRGLFFYLFSVSGHYGGSEDVNTTLSAPSFGTVRLERTNEHVGVSPTTEPRGLQLRFSLGFADAT